MNLNELLTWFLADSNNPSNIGMLSNFNQLSEVFQHRLLRARCQ